MAMLVNVCDVSSIFDSGDLGGGISLLLKGPSWFFNKFRMDCHESFLKKLFAGPSCLNKNKINSATGVFFHLPTFACIVLLFSCGMYCMKLDGTA